MMITPSQSLSPAEGQCSRRAPVTEGGPGSTPVASPALRDPPAVDPTPDMVALVRALARSEARRLHRRERGFGLVETAAVLSLASVLLAVIMLALGGRLSLGW